jgi:rhodanese-related sulfurtransferase
MFESIKSIFGLKQTDYKQLMKDGAVILDVRSSSEYASGHIEGSINISVNKLADDLSKLKDKKKPIITCCASGMRSASAKGILESIGYENVHNGGAWQNLNQKIK